MTTSIAESSPSARGRILAALYLLVIVCGITGQAFISDRLVVATDATQTAANILANRSLYRLAFSIFMVEMVAQVALSMMFYDLLKPVNRSASRIAAVIGVTGSGIKALARLFYYTPLILLGSAPYLTSMAPAQLATLSLAFLKINSLGAAIGIIFFGFESALRGWLIIKSDFLPRILGLLELIGGLAWLTFIWPPLGYAVFTPVALFALVGVVATCGWLLFRGVDDAKWRARAALAATSIWR